MAVGAGPVGVGWPRGLAPWEWALAPWAGPVGVGWPRGLAPWEWALAPWAGPVGVGWPRGLAPWDIRASRSEVMGYPLPCRPGTYLADRLLAWKVGQRWALHVIDVLVPWRAFFNMWALEFSQTSSPSHLRIFSSFP